MDKWLWMLSGMRILTRGEGDCNVAKSHNGSVQADFQAWKVKFLNRLQDLAKGEKRSSTGSCRSGSGPCKSKMKKSQGRSEEEEAALHDDSFEVKMEEQSIRFMILLVWLLVVNVLTSEGCRLASRGCSAGRLCFKPLHLEEVGSLPHSRLYCS